MTLSDINLEITLYKTSNFAIFLQDIQLSESPILIKLMDGEVGIMVVGYKHHWEVLESGTGQVRTMLSYIFYFSTSHRTQAILS